MPSLSKELVNIRDLSMPFVVSVIKAYSRMGMVFTSGDLSRKTRIPPSIAKYYIRKMLDMHMIPKTPHQKHQKYINAKTSPTGSLICLDW